MLAARKTLSYEVEYRAWLGQRGLSGRSLSDVVSRTRRAAELADILAAGTDAEVLFRLSQDGQFEALTPNIKSQLKRAVSLYRNFARSRKGQP